MAPPDSESGPNLGSFNELGATAAAGGIVGTNHLQDAITKLTQAVTEFDTTVNKLQGVSSKLSGGAGLSGAWNNNGIETFAKQSAGKLGGNFNLAGPAMNVAGVTSMAQAGGPNMGGTLGGVCTNTGGGAYKGYGQPSGGSGGMGAFGGGGGGGYGAGQPGLGPVPGQPRAGGDVWARAVNGGGSAPSKAATFAALGATVAAAGAGFAVSAGKAQMAPQLALNSYQQQAQLISPLGSNYGQNQQAFAQATYGTQGRMGGQASYAGWGNSGQDIAATYSMISGYTGQTPTAINRAGQGTVSGQMMQGVGTLNYLNPGLGGQGAAALQQSMFNPSTSLNMRTLGYNTTPLKPGGQGANGTGQVIGSMMSRWGWGANNRLSPGKMSSALAPGGTAYYNMLAMGYSPQQEQQLAPEITAYGRLYEGNGKGAPGLTANQADQMLSGLHARNPQIRQQTDRRLQAYGIGQTDISQMQANAGSQAATMGDQSAGFTKGLKDATGALEQFRKVIGQINNSTGLSTGIGFGKGFGGMMSTGTMTGISGGVGGLLGALLGPVLKGLLGRGAGGAAGEAAKGIGGLWKGAGGAGEGAGAAGAGVGLGTAAGAAGLGLAGWGAQKGLEGAARSHIKGKGGSTVGDLLGLANPFNFGGWHKDFSGLWHNLFGGGATSPGSSTVAGGGSLNNLMTTGNSSRQSMAAVKAAESQVGVPYKWGAEIPGKGFDCAGLTQWAYRQAGVQLPRTVEEQWKFLQGRAINPKAVQEGDLVFGAAPGGDINNPTHVGMVVQGGRVIEAPYTGGQIGIRPYQRAQWQRAARPASSMTNTKKNFAGAAGTNKNSPKTSGDLVSRAQTYSGHKYVWGGPANAQGGFDCSSFVNMVAGMEGLPLPGGFHAPAGSHGPNTTAWLADSAMQKVPKGSEQRNDLYVSSTHMGIVVAPGQGFAARSTATGTGPQSDTGEAYTYMRFPGVGANSGAANTNQAAATSPNWGNAGQAGMGESTSEGSTSELSSFMGAVGGGISAGSPWKPGAVAAASAGGGATGAANFTAGSSSANGKAIYTYLLGALFGGNKVAAAGAIASIWGESTWNPEASGTGGRGLIGWTPASKLPNSAFTGNATNDLNAQLPLIVQFVNSNGDQGAIDSMKKQTSLAAAANIWGRQVERFGINDVHPAGLAAAAAIAGIPNNYRGGSVAAGSFSLVGERGPEVVWNPKAGHVLDASQSRKLMMSAMGPHTAGPTNGYNYSSLHRAFSGGSRTPAAGGGGCVVNISNLNLGGGGNASGTPGVTSGQTPSWMPNGIMNTQNPARSFAKYIAGLIEQETMHNQISGGVNA